MASFAALPQATTDPARLAAVQTVAAGWDDDPELQDLVELAAHVCEAPMSAVSLVDDHCQRFLARVGLEADQTPVEQAFCAHALARPTDVTVVPDATVDPRFADNPLVTGAPHVRFYAGAPLVTAHGHALGTVCVVDDRPRELDIGQRRALATVARQVAGLIERRTGGLPDPLTGLPGREALATWLAACHEGEPVALALVDLDDFTRLTLGLGPDASDTVLRTFATRLRDSATADDAVVHLTADQFALAARGDGELNPVQRLTRTASVLNVPVEIEQRPVQVSASVGVASGRAPTGHRVLLQQAALAARTAKRRGGGQVVAFDDALAQRAGRRWQLEEALRSSAIHDQLWLAIQPIVEVATGRIGAGEALVRWNHPELGSVAPEELLAVAEATGHVPEVGQWVLDESLRWLARWRAEPAGAGLRLNVNLSPTQLDDPQLVPVLAELLQTHAVPAEALTLELTESVILRHLDDALPRLTALHGLGVRVAIDDFGTGYSALSRLHRLPIDDVKIDQAFVAGIGARQRDEHLLQAVVQLVSALGFGAVAEGVASEQQADWLRDHGVERAQGAWYGEPAVAEHFGSLLRSRAARGPHARPVA